MLSLSGAHFYGLDFLNYGRLEVSVAAFSATSWTQLYQKTIFCYTQGYPKIIFLSCTISIYVLLPSSMNSDWMQVQGMGDLAILVLNY